MGLFCAQNRLWVKSPSDANKKDKHALEKQGSHLTVGQKAERMSNQHNEVFSQTQYVKQLMKELNSHIPENEEFNKATPLGWDKWSPSDGNPFTCLQCS